jgi:hypothetical protein
MTPLKFWLAVTVLLVLLLVVLPTFEEVRHVLVGWVLFLARVVPRVRVDWKSVLVGLSALVLFAAGLHAAGRTWRPGWRLRWSLACVGLVFVLFTAGVALVGIVHQVGWLATSPEPFRVPVERARRGHPSSYNLHEMSHALSNYEGTFGAFPPGERFTPEGAKRHSWETHIMIFVGEGYTPRDLELQLPWNDPRNARYFKCVIPEFTNADLRVPTLFDPEGYGLSHYAANVHVMGPNRAMKLDDITDGLANTLMIGEVNANFQPWGHPVNWRDPARGINRSPYGFGGPPGAAGASFVLADGSVRFVSDKVSPAVLRALATPNGGEEVDASVLPPVDRPPFRLP